MNTTPIYFLVNCLRGVRNMSKVIATIDISRPSGRKIVRELQNKRAVKLEYPLPEGKTYTLEEVYEKGLDKLSEHYGVDMRQLKSLEFFPESYPVQMKLIPYR